MYTEANEREIKMVQYKKHKLNTKEDSSEKMRNDVRHIEKK